MTAEECVLYVPGRCNIDAFIYSLNDLMIWVLGSS